MPFTDRRAAGRLLAERLRHLRGGDIVVLGLPRGGVPVAFEVAQALGAPLDVIVVRKLRVPFRPELAMGAIGEGDVTVRNERVLSMTQVGEAVVHEAERRERAELSRAARVFRGGRPPVALAGRTAIIVDDGIATGSTAQAACQIAAARGAALVVLAAPVCAPGSLRLLRQGCDELICLETPARFVAVGAHYTDFGQTSDAEVAALLTPSEQS